MIYMSISQITSSIVLVIFIYSLTLLGTVAPTTKTVSGTQRPQHPLPTTTASNEQNSATSSPMPISTRSTVQSTIMMSTPSQSGTCKANNSDVQINSSSLEDTFKVEKLSIQVTFTFSILSYYVSLGVI